MLLSERFVSVQSANDEEGLREAIVRFARLLEHQTVTAFVVVDHPFGDSEFFNIHVGPEGYDALANSPESAGRDPVMQHCKTSNQPIIWSQQTYLAAGRIEKWEEQAQFGFQTGICLATHLPGGRHFCIGVDRDRPLPACQEEVTRLTAELHLFAAHAQDVALRVLVPQAAVPVLPNLTPRERECLQWTIEGKTAWEVGGILGISEQTAVRHLNNATHKLGCVNKHQAAVKALRLGLIL